MENKKDLIHNKKDLIHKSDAELIESCLLLGEEDY
jgi:hypothetical protein